MTFRQPGDILAVGGAAALGIIAPVLAIIMLRYAPTLFGRPYGVVAAEEGIECATEFGRKFLVRWDEIRLFEVSGSGRSELGSRQYRVYGRRHMVSWSTSPAQGNEFAPDGITPGEMALRLQAMINLVVARTGLQPRTFSKALRATPRPENAAADRVVLLGVAVVALLLAVAAVALPLTDAAWLNVIIGVSLGLTGLLLATWTLRRRRGRPLQPETALPGALLAAAPHVPAGTTVTLSFGATRRTRVLLALVGLPLCANLAPVLLVWFGDGLQRILPGGALPSLTSPVAVGVAFVLAIYGAGGLALLRPAVTGNRRAIVASDRGVSTSLGGVGVAIPWESIERIVAVERTGERLRYAVYRPPSRRALAWPARATTWQTFLPTLNAQMVTPDQLAALVVERSGRTLTIESDA